MTQFLQLEEPQVAQRAAPEWKAFMAMGFRPLYLAGCVWAALSVTLWVFAPQWLQGRLGGMPWHAHEMLWAFVATIAVGFLLTAAGNWTGRNPLEGKPLAAVCVLWCVARIALLLPGAPALVLAAVSGLLFFAAAAAAIGRVIYATRSRRNYGLPPLLLGLGVADALYLWSAWQGDYGLLMQRFYAGLLCMAVIALLIARRVIPFFAMRAVAGLHIPMLTGSGPWQLGAACLALAGVLLGWTTGQVLGLAVAGLFTLWQVLAWKPWAVRQVPLLWILYLGHVGLGLGLLLAAAQAAGWVLRLALPVHAIGVAGFSVLIFGMCTRTALGHLGRPLRTDASMVAAYGLVIAAAVLRLLALWPTTLSLAALHASALAWVLGFVLYLWRFLPLLIRPRADQAASAAATIQIRRP